MPSSFPTKILELAPYLFRATTHLTANAVRLGVDATKLTAIIALYGNITTPDTYLYCLKLWGDNASKTKLVNDKLRTISDSLKAMLAEIYNDIPTSKWTDNDRLALNRKTGLVNKKTYKQTPISDRCVAAIRKANYGLFHIVVRTSTDSKRCSILGEADSVEVAYVVVESKFRTKTAADEAVRQTNIGPEDHTTRVVSFKARFELQIPVALSGFNLKCWFRWTNSRHPELASQWSTQQLMMIS